MPEMLD